ncbi:MAG: alpha/beta hydrolase, partial [Saprospiraceae bacterium]
HVGEWYNKHQLAVTGIDLQGNGRSGGKKGHIRNLDAFFDDIELLINHTQKLYPSVPLILYGHSMGGNLVLNYMLRRKDPTVQLLIVSAPWIRLAFPAPKAKILAGRVLHRIVPKLRLPTGLAVHFLSKDQAVVDMYRFDPYVHDQLSTRAGISMLTASEWLDAYKGTLPTPTLIMHGSEDKITSPEASEEFAGRVQGDVRFKSWEGLYHEIHNEVEKEEVFNFTLKWLDKYFHLGLIG